MSNAKIRGDYCAACAANKHAPTDSQHRLWCLNWAARLSASLERGRRVPSAINEASAHVALQATNYCSNCGDRQRRWRTLRSHARGAGVGHVVDAHLFLTDCSLLSASYRNSSAVPNCSLWFTAICAPHEAVPVRRPLFGGRTKIYCFGAAGGFISR